MNKLIAMKHQLVYFAAFALTAFSCTSQDTQFINESIVVKIPYDSGMQKHAYRGSEDFQTGNEDASEEITKEWSKKRLSKVLTGTNKRDREVSGQGTFKFSQALKVIGTVNHKFTISFTSTIKIHDKAVSYLFTDIVVTQEGSLIDTTVTLEDFVKQYQRQSSLNRDVVDHVNRTLEKIDQHINEYAADLEQSLRKG